MTSPRSGGMCVQSASGERDGRAVDELVDEDVVAHLSVGIIEPLGILNASMTNARSAERDDDRDEDRLEVLAHLALAPRPRRVSTSPSARIHASVNASSSNGWRPSLAQSAEVALQRSRSRRELADDGLLVALEEHLGLVEQRAGPLERGPRRSAGCRPERRVRVPREREEVTGRPERHLEEREDDDPDRDRLLAHDPLDPPEARTMGSATNHTPQ
jgi:hypothetical protein